MARSAGASSAAGIVVVLLVIGALGIRRADRAIVQGRASLDGAPFDAPYLGAVVHWHGLITPCQRTLPRVRHGSFSIPVYANAVARGCGRKGAEISLWTFVGDQTVYSANSLRWPGRGSTVSFHPRFASATPDGGVGPMVGFAGEVFDRRGRRLPPGADIAAYIGNTRCAVATTRVIEDFTGFSLYVVGPESIPGCVRNGTITFRVDGRVANETALNEPSKRTTLNLTLR
jgi:hypothetical protein